MKSIFTLLLCVLFKLALGQQTRIVTRTEIRSGSPDTNKVVYDEQGKQLKFFQYAPLLKSGQYKVRFNGDPALPETKGQLIKMTADDRSRVEQIKMYGLTPINNNILKVNTALDVMPLSAALQKDFFSTKPLLMMFWSPDIPSSMSAVIQMSTILRGYNPDSLVVLLITTADKSRADVLRKAATTMNARIVSNAEEIFNFYEVTAMPLYLVADQNRIIRHNSTGTGMTMALATKEILDEVLGLVPQGLYSLHRDPMFTELSNKAFTLFKAENYPEAAKAYEALFEYSKGKSTIGETFNAACAWARLGDKDKAFNYLKQAVFTQKLRSLSMLTNNPHLESLRTDKRWDEIMEQVKKNVAASPIRPAGLSNKKND